MKHLSIIFIFLVVLTACGGSGGGSGGGSDSGSENLEQPDLSVAPADPNTGVVESDSGPGEIASDPVVTVPDPVASDPEPTIPAPVPVAPVVPSPVPVTPVPDVIAPTPNPVAPNPEPVIPVVTPVIVEPEPVAPVDPVTPAPEPVDPVMSDPEPVDPVTPDPDPVIPVVEVDTTDLYSVLVRLTNDEYIATMSRMLNLNDAAQAELRARVQLSDEMPDGGLVSSAERQQLSQIALGRFLVLAEAAVDIKLNFGRANPVNANNFQNRVECRGDFSGSNKECLGFIGSQYVDVGYRGLGTTEDVQALNNLFSMLDEIEDSADDGTAAQQAFVRLIRDYTSLVQFISLSPKFSMHLEKGDASQGSELVRPLREREIANKLAFFIAGTPPDEALESAAAAGLLNIPNERSAQVSRLVADEDSLAGVQEIVANWLGLNPELASDEAINDVRDFINTWIVEGRPFSDLYTAMVSVRNRSSLDASRWALDASRQPDDVAAAIDGDPATRWTTRQPQRPGQRLTVDLGGVETFDTVELFSAKPLDSIRGYDLFVSDDGVAWGSPIASSGADFESSEVVLIQFPAVTARHIRIDQTAPQDVPQWWAVNELDVRLSSGAASDTTSQPFGILGFQAVVASHTNDPVPSFINRGEFITAELLCAQLPTDIPDQAINGDVESAVQVFEEHGKEPCASCHVVFDNYGAALQRFDQSTSLYSPTDDWLGDSFELFPIGDVSGSVSDPADLSAILGASRQAHTCFASLWYRHAIRRDLLVGNTSADNQIVSTIVSEWMAGDTSVQSLLELITSHESFDKLYR